MQSVSTLFNSLFNGQHRAVMKVVINDDLTFNENSIVKIKTFGSLFSDGTFSFGGCVSRQLDLAFYPGNNIIPRMAKIQVFMRLTNGSQNSEWISKGVFFIDTRDIDDQGLLTITGYDALLKAEQDYVPVQTEQSMADTAAEIATALGVELDARCQFKEYDCQLTNGYTMREILGYIAAAHAGNWVITDEGKLRLIRASTVTDTFYLSRGQLARYEKSNTLERIGKVIIQVDDENTVESESIEGRTIELECPWAVAQWAQSVWYESYSVEYVPGRVSAFLHPAAEIGDKITIAGTTHIIGDLTINHNADYLAEIEAPGESEIDHEFPFRSSTDRKTNRQFENVRQNCSDLRETTEEISSRIDGIESQKMLQLVITSSNGNIFKNGNISTTLSAKVYSWDVDITDTLDDNQFRWTRVSADAAADTLWNQQHYGGTKSITITGNDVSARATFYCDLVDPNTNRSLL